HASKLLSASGGMQKEAYFFKVPCITLREETEWVETVEDGWNVIVGTDKERILTAIKNFSPQKEQRALFGDGTASLKIVKILEDTSCP
ncbi:MAG: UDP-N-acetyl glucosamine 2-epimerase, partial [candidate division KSB1 bacterium]|nr:UDP-N-acetyl glucosamine 2-epimerase [candidate division KSB1 bacterium]